MALNFQCIPPTPSQRQLNSTHRMLERIDATVDPHKLAFIGFFRELFTDEELELAERVTGDTDLMSTQLSTLRPESGISLDHWAVQQCCAQNIEYNLSFITYIHLKAPFR